MFKRAKKVLVTVILFAAIAGTFPALGKKVDKKVPPSKPDGVDWSAQLITATGIGAPRPNAKIIAIARLSCVRSARANAYRKFLKLIQNINFDSETTVNEVSHKYVPAEHNTLHMVPQKPPKYKQIGDPIYHDDGSCGVTMGAKLTGIISDKIFPSSRYFGSKTREIPSGSSKVYTGLIIDATGLGGAPALAPKVLDEKGNELYGISYLSRENAVKHGVALYTKTIKEAKGHSRAGSNPLVIKAIKVSGSKKVDVVITLKDAAKLKDPTQNMSFLKECKVIIVL